MIGLAPTNAVVADLRKDGYAHAATLHRELGQVERDLTPVNQSDLLKFISRVFEQLRDSNAVAVRREKAADQIASLTSRQRQVMDMVLAGHPSKNIASDLGISQRTVENHRASIMERTQTKSIPALARLAIIASGTTSADRACRHSALLTICKLFNPAAPRKLEGKTPFKHRL